MRKFLILFLTCILLSSNVQAFDEYESVRIVSNENEATVDDSGRLSTASELIDSGGTEIGTQENPISTSIRVSDTASIDGFARLRVSNPETLFDSKQIFDNAPLLWDDQEVSGSGTTSVYSQDEARTRIGVSTNTAGKRIRQTFMRFNYQPGKSQLVFMTGVMSSANVPGVKTSMGLFDDDNGLFFTNDGGVLKAVTRSSVSGSPVDSEVTQSNFNLDSLDGTGPSGITFDITKTQIIVFDFEWLGVGRVRMGFVIDGKVYYAHEFLYANSLSMVYMSTPNLPLRYSIENDGTGAATTMDHICATVISEGGTQDNGILFNHSTNGTHIDANSANTVYAVLGIRLKSTHVGSTIKLISASLISETNDDFEWIIYLNPTMAGTFTYSDKTNSAVQVATGVTANTISGGTSLYCAFAKQSAAADSLVPNAVSLGAAIDGTVDEIVLAVRPLSANADIQAALNWREAA